MSDQPPLEFMYKNYKGVVSKRRVIPWNIYFGSTEFHPVNQYLMEGYDCDKEDVRTFAVVDMLFTRPDSRE